VYTLWATSSRSFRRLRYGHPIATLKSNPKININPVTRIKAYKYDLEFLWFSVAQP